MKKVLLLLAALAASAAIALALSSPPDSRIDDVESALFRAEANEGMADSAPQQQVVNGWAAKDLLEIQARQFDDLAGDQRTQTIVIALVGMTALLALAGVAQRELSSTAPASAQTIPPVSSPGA